MSTTLTYGHILPADGDKGSTFFDNLEANVVIDDSHTHNGTNSSLLPSSSITNATTSILAAAWVAVSGKEGLYRQLVTMPTGMTMGTRGISFVDSSTGHFYTLTVEKLAATTYYVYINDNSIALTAIYM